MDAEQKHMIRYILTSTFHSYFIGTTEKKKTFKSVNLTQFDGFLRCWKRRRTADRGGAGSTFLGKQVAEAVEAVGEVIPGGEPLAHQLLLAPDADEALLMPRLVPVVHPSGGDGLVEGRVRDQ